MTPELTVIIPCYNCAGTLREAVESCFDQGLKDSDGRETFEIVMVDDGSTDNTRAVMEELAKEYENIRCVYHEKNAGGGAARNTAVAHAASDVIFCLDSDDVLGQHALSIMLALLREKNADGVGIHRSHKFRGTNIHDIEMVHTFDRAGEQIPLSDLLERHGLCSLYSTFMFTKAAFTRAGGYPINHGFDTQSFAWRFLAAGNIAYTPDDADYFQRVQFAESYYLREANGGRINYNWFEIFDEHFPVLSDAMQQTVLYFDYQDITINAYDALRASAGNLTLRSSEEWESELRAKDSTKLRPAEEYWLGCQSLKRGAYKEARELFMLANRTKPSKVISEKLLRVELLEKGLSGDAIATKITSHRAYVRRNSIKGVTNRIGRRIKSFLGSSQKMRDRSLGMYLLYQDIQIRLHARHAFSLLLNLFRLKIQKVLHSKFPRDCSGSTKETVDVVILTLPKDRELLEVYVQHLRENICEAIGTIFMIAPKDESLEAYCSSEGIIFKDERTILGYGKDHIEYSVNGQNRSGWLFQQLLKLSGDTFVTSERYIIVDADTLLVRPHAFRRNGKSVFVESSEWQEPYFRSFEKLFGYEAPARCSLTAHMMVFTVARLKEMKAEIEKKHGVRWDEAYVKAGDRTVSSGISDYDTYGNWLLYNYPSEVERVPFYNKSFSRKLLPNLEVLKKDYASSNASFSFHSYNA
jgi:glycosyltransferase involved in cell wall biosynthesis